MRRSPLLPTILLLASCEPAAPPADTILFGGTIYTLAGDQPSPVEALAITQGAVVAVGSREDIERLAGEDTERIDLEGGYATPGLVDAHAHLVNLAKLLRQANLIGTTSAEECVERTRAHAEKLPDGAWITGRGWDQNDWEENVYPDRSLLDEAFGDRPVYLRRVDGHAGWVNGAALAAAGFDRDTPDPPGGEILRDPETGEPTGILIDAADDSMQVVVPDPGAAERARSLREAIETAVAAGLTGVHEMGVTEEEFALFRGAEREGWLRLRLVAYLGGDAVLQAHDGGPERPSPDQRLRLEGVKLYADGALGSRGAALLEDYADRPGHRGLLLTSEEDLVAGVRRAFARGFGVAIHAIGDRGNRVALDAIRDGHAEALLKDPSVPPLKELRPRIEHVQVLHLDDLPRFHSLGVIPSMQPTHCTSDMPWAPERLGPERLAGAYAWRKLLDDDNILPLGSDFPVEEVAPRYGLWAARTRQTPEGKPRGGWSPEERLTPLEALLGFTVWAAEAAGVREWGRLVPGSRADVTVLDRDPLAKDAREILEATALLTMVEGTVVHRADVSESP